jgi:hypothetical protein
MSFKKPLGFFLMTFFAVFLFVGATLVHSQQIVQVDPDDYPWLSFTSMEEFQCYMDSIKEMTDEELEQHENDIGFYSLRKAMNEVGNPEVDCIGGFETAERANEDPILSSVMNPASILQIGADVIVVAENVVYRVPEDKTDVIEQLDYHAEEVPSNLPEGVEAKLIERAITTIPPLGGEDVVSLQAMGFAGCFVRYLWRYRLLGYSWASNFWFYASSGAITVSQRRWRWLWWWWWRFWPVTWVQVNTTYNLVLWPWGINVAATVTRTRNNSPVVYVLSVVQAGWGVFLRGTVTTTHTLNNNGTIVTCATTINI